jgi:hypothetical protein
LTANGIEPPPLVFRSEPDGHVTKAAIPQSFPGATATAVHDEHGNLICEVTRHSDGLARVGGIRRRAGVRGGRTQLAALVTEVGKLKPEAKCGRGIRF